MSATQPARETRPSQQLADFTELNRIFSTGWSDAQQRMERFQHVAEEINETVYRTSLDQVQDMFAVFNRMSETLATVHDPKEFVSVQPEIYGAFVDVFKTSNQRLLELSEKLRRQGMEMLSPEGSEIGAEEKRTAPAAKSESESKKSA